MNRSGNKRLNFVILVLMAINFYVDSGFFMVIKWFPKDVAKVLDTCA